MIDINKKYRTRDGREVRILCTDLDDSKQPVVAHIGGEGTVHYYTPDGYSSPGKGARDEDLIEVREPREFVVWLRQSDEIYDCVPLEEGDKHPLGSMTKIRVREVIEP